MQPGSEHWVAVAASDTEKGWAMAAKASYLEHYLAGDCEQVWADLQVLGSATRIEPLHADALAVARETMRRVRHNLELLIARLQTIGYSFGDEWKWAAARLDGYEQYLAHREQPEPVIAPPGLDIAAQLAEMETLRGTIPISVAAWYEAVGSVNFTGLTPESWWQMRSEPGTASGGMPGTQGEVSDKELDLRDERLVERRDYTYWLDPIYFWPLEQAIRNARFENAVLRGEFDIDISAWRDDYIPVIPMGPDMHIKYDYSGGGNIGVQAPDPSVDGLFQTDQYQGLFVDYLRLCCRHAGLPGLRDLPQWICERGVPARVEQIERDMRYLTEGLLPF
jgi:hypothetical protein